MIDCWICGTMINTKKYNDGLFQDHLEQMHVKLTFQKEAEQLGIPVEELKQAELDMIGEELNR